MVNGNHDDIVTFRKSSYCEAGGCVEVSTTGPDVLIRNSTNINGPTLAFTAQEWDAFLKGVRNNEFELG